ncbi:acyl carrier protein [Nocardia sp. NPDC050408]|uniref:acyl carrier protein n=1 Tax=Nocardia sp. NPDC050408 TaxID=3364319 RepID=UPI003792E6E0
MTRSIPERVDPEDLRQLVARVLEVPAAEIGDHTNFVDEWNVDSLLELELATRIEERYRIAIPETELASLTSLANVRELVDRMLGADPNS